jgi:pyruvate dehydrogenase E1 component
MTALYFAVLRPEDRVAVKPHASPVFHAIQYLLGNQTREKLENFRGYKGAQSYPSRTKDTDDVDFSTGSVGLGVAQTPSPRWCRTTSAPRAGAAGTGPRAA